MKFGRRTANPCEMFRPRLGEAGLTVLEVLVASTVTAVAVLVVLTVAQAALRQSAETRQASEAAVDVALRRVLGDLFSCMRPADMTFRSTAGTQWVRTDACLRVAVTATDGPNGQKFRLQLAGPAERAALEKMVAVGRAAAEVTGEGGLAVRTAGGCACTLDVGTFRSDPSTSWVDVECASGCTPRTGPADVAVRWTVAQVVVRQDAGSPVPVPASWAGEVAPRGLSVVFFVHLPGDPEPDPGDPYPSNGIPLRVSVHAPSVPGPVGWTFLAGSLRYAAASRPEDFEGVLDVDLDGDGDLRLGVGEAPAVRPVPVSAVDGVVFFFQVAGRRQGSAERCGPGVIPAGAGRGCLEDSYRAW